MSSDEVRLELNEDLRKLASELRTSLPEEVRDLYDDIAILYRFATPEHTKKFDIGWIKRGMTNYRFKEILKKAYGEDPGDEIVVLPRREWLKGKYGYDMIGIVVRHDDLTTLILEDNRIDRPKSGGAGKTAMIIKIMGINLDYSKFPDDPDELEGKKYMLKLEKDSGIGIVEADSPFMYAKNGEIHVLPTLGRKAVASWDLARHILRVKKGVTQRIGYREVKEAVTYKERERKLHQRLAESLVLPEEFFAPEGEYKIDQVIVIDRRMGEYRVEVERENEEYLKILLQNNPIYHHSLYWRLNEEEFRKRVNKLLGSLEKYPEVIRMIIYSNPEEDQKKVVEETAKVFYRLMKGDV